MTLSRVLLAACALLATLPVSAQQDRFGPGGLIPEFGAVAKVETTTPLAADTRFRVSFDTTAGAGIGAHNRTLLSAARFLNMHADAGIAPENMRLAVVVHGTAVQDVTNAAHYGDMFGGAGNANAELVAALLAHGVRVIVCGQSAAFAGVDKDDLLPGVEMALSAMTAHALLQQEGYSLNPF